MSDGVLTRALADLSRAGIPIAAALDPARRDDILRAPGIGLKAYDRLQETAAIAADLQVAPKRARSFARRDDGGINDTRVFDLRSAVLCKNTRSRRASACREV